jgi:ribosomal protein S18 acetylase RimI-like enzyme
MSSPARAATVPDIPVLVDLMEEFHAEAGYPLDRERAAASFTALLGNPALGAAWLLRDDEGPVGYVVLTLRFSMEYGGLEASIDDLFVRPSSRRRGLARRAVEALFLECARRGVRAVQVVVGRDNPAAQALYRGFGLVAPEDGREVLSVRVRGFG